MKHKRSVISIAMAAIMLLSLCAVASTTGVMAANGNSNTNVGSAAGGITPPDQTQTNLVGAPMAAESNNNARASVTASPDLVGAPIAAGTGPSACILTGSSTDMYVFVKGYDGALWYRIWSTSSYQWTGSWVSLGGQLTSSPAAASSTENGVPAIEVYVRGTNGVTYGKEYYQGAWSGWYIPGGNGGQIKEGTGPGVAMTANRIDLFVAGTDGALYQKTWTGSWSSWTNLGGVLTSSPAAVSWGSTARVDVFVRGTDGALWTKQYIYDIGYWTNWITKGGQIAAGTGPAACAYGSTSDSTSRFDVFVQGTNGALYQITYTMASGSWSSWTNLGGVLSASPTAVTYTYGGAIDIMVFVRGSNGLIYQKEYFGGGWTSWMAGGQGPP